ncbi:Response regulator receiver domain-containing protein [Fodinibius salinus]|uniref:Response regulator receiver domain-containing protein n=1 Tax=Fodinibius salinus TaxID=860790 RepID=A0A5D3YL71_9BACT|nr:response regulator [Fodinibius salinus]TYP93407.1 Response regulator receiver domain-containing protein [Fodinibius salinus]
MNTLDPLYPSIGIYYSPENSSGASANSPSPSNEILIVDDDELTRQLFNRLLDREFDKKIVLFSNGLKALEYAKENIPCLMILDLMLPGMSGYEVLQNVRKNAIFQNTKVVLVSAKSRSEDIKRGFDLSADEYITKPLQPKEFIARIRKLITKAA